MLECATEVEEVWKIDRGMGDNSPVPIAKKKKTIILLFCPNLRKNLNIKATCDLLPTENKLCREGRSTWPRAAHQLLHISTCGNHRGAL